MWNRFEFYSGPEDLGRVQCLRLTGGVVGETSAHAQDRRPECASFGLPAGQHYWR